MSVGEKVTLTRDCEGTLVPSGESVTLSEGAEVNITHHLGGNYTVAWDYGMARISGANADALGFEVDNTIVSKKADHDGPPDNEAIWEQLKGVYDPEIPVNIVDLGLVYSVKVDEEDGKYDVNVDMTLTAPGCGMGPAIAEDAQGRVMSVPGVNDANVNIVWDPPWHQDMITEEGKMHLGLI